MNSNAIYFCLSSQAVLVCQSPWIEFQGSCYYRFTGAKAWETAKLTCIGNSAQLVKIESSDENNFIESQFLPTGSEDYWIGLTDEEIEGTWKWSDGSSLTGYTNWDPGQPSDSSGWQNCGGIRKSGAVWHDKSCSNLKGFICEK